MPTHAGEANDNILCIGLLDLEEYLTVNDQSDGVLDIIWLAWIFRDDRIQCFIHAQGIIKVVYKRWIFHVILWDVG